MFQITTKHLSSELDLPASMQFIMLSEKILNYILNRSIMFHQGVGLDNVNGNNALTKRLRRK